MNCDSNNDLDTSFEESSQHSKHSENDCSFEEILERERLSLLDTSDSDEDDIDIVPQEKIRNET